ncbi:MAG UNVERIFIED_CONTAM: hypothetical protein LVR18_36725 [Planctomycetaceae bacterium]
MTGAVSSDCHQSSGAIGSNERSSPAHAATPNAEGIVPVTWSLSSDYYQSSGAIGSNERTSPTHAATP